ncbi:MAG: site-specific integrase [Bacteroides sp.]|jgi:integrase|nr:site-specific integrase [Bacteroides sp.]
MKKTLILTEYMTSVMNELRRSEQYSTAHVYSSVIRSVSAYAGREFLLSGITPVFLKGYEDYLILQKGLEWNTSSTYMRCLQSVYNRALRDRDVSFIPQLFKGVFTGVKRNHRRALSVEDMRRLLREPGQGESCPASPISAGVSSASVLESPASCPESFDLRKARICLELMVRLQGMCFVDLAFLRKSDLKRGYLMLRRHKTHMPLCIRVTDDIRRLLSLYLNGDASSPYLLTILDGHLRGYAAYRDYQCKLRRFNAALKGLARKRRVCVSVSTYCARHTWATQAKYCGIPTSVISEGLGHASVTTTESYLKSFESGVLDRANARVTAYIFNGKKEKQRCAETAGSHYSVNKLLCR